jgi:hypothetical protein
MWIAACFVPAPAGSIREANQHHWREENALADCALPRAPLHPSNAKAASPQIRATMRAEIERLVEEIKQSVGLLRRHL